MSVGYSEDVNRGGLGAAVLYISDSEFMIVFYIKRCWNGVNRNYRSIDNCRFFCNNKPAKSGRLESLKSDGL